MSSSFRPATEQTRRFLSEWFARLEATGFDGGIFLDALSDDLLWTILADGEWAVVQFRGVGGVGRNGADYTLEYCWVIRVVDDRVREVVGYYDQVKVAELFA